MTEGSGQGMVQQVLVIRVYGLVGQLLKIAGVEVISRNWVHFLWRELYTLYIMGSSVLAVGQVKC